MCGSFDTLSQVLRWIGKGGFGDVIKVRNKLDAGLYAIKRIPLNPKSKKLTKNITREVKLLSRLNHDNVVRYFNSWIETCVDDFRAESTTDFSLTSDEGKKTSAGRENGGGGGASRLAILKKETPKENSLGLVDDIEIDVPPPAEADSWKSDSDDDADDEDDEDDDMDVFGFSFGLSFDSDTEVLSWKKLHVPLVLIISQLRLIEN